MFSGKYEWSGDREAGDCSIRIFDASEVDDGDWECQVTASSFTAHDALTSRIAELVVRVAPNRPQMEVETLQVASGQNFTVQEERTGKIKCISRFGNPPAEIKWFIGEEELPAEEYEQTNVTEAERSKTWMAVSALEHTYHKEDHGLPLRCVAVHQAYRTKSESVEVILDVQYAPTVTLEGAPSGDIEEGVDDVTLRCLVDANPAAKVVWRVLGETDVFSFLPEVKFSPASRRHSATYTCEGRNSVGASDPISVKIDVKYGPRVLQVGPAPVMTVALHNHTLLDCLAEGNPPPKYMWRQTVPDTQEVLMRGTNSTLLLEDVTYEHQGQYECVVSNTIKGEEIEEISMPITLEVVGAPQVLRYTVERNVQVEKGEDALIQVMFCSDPRPLRTTWEWGSLQLEAGNDKGRYVAENLAQQDTREDCYAARLRVQHADVADARDYILNVENDKGKDRYAVGLRVNEPVSMSTVIGIVIACLVVLVIVTLFVLYAFKTEKWCFSRVSSPWRRWRKSRKISSSERGDFKPTDLESDKSDIESQKGNNGRHQYSATGSGAGRSGGKTMVAGSLASIPPDALYTTTSKHTSVSTLSSKPDHEYENLKIMPTPMGTQNLCQETRSSSSCSSRSSNPERRDELNTALGEPGESREEEEEEEQESASEQGESSNSNLKKGELHTFKRHNDQQSDAKDLPRNFKSSPYVPVYKPNPDRISSPYADRMKSTATASVRRPSTGVVYAELQLPRASNNGSMRRGDQRTPLQKTQYAEITFQGRPLQTAEI
ncbi:irregular chiasm C-roughest protein-like isoform X3 [Penaeus chinensis]|uniref:irregular chiasm C-roughest protein-like isoform X3 n=1 Tax=Penaeus chinensis TaxID=139456 RepID=UPI001FB6256D|nr:irregular chiasm C-roughest protein-like isoform X3 [Penaeus chinensis]